MARVILDFDPPMQRPPEFQGDTSELVYFLSWAFSARYGGNHELSVASLILRGEFGIDLKPLLTFADRDVELEADAEMMEKAWQEPGPLAETCAAVVSALDSEEPRLAAIAQEYPELRNRVAELAEIARWAAERGSRIRVTFLLEEPA
jgi:hypothetical protein